MKKILVYCCLAFTIGSVAAQTRPALPAPKHSLIVIAHRGNHVAVPENSIAAIEQAIACGADYVEMDVRTTADGKLVLMHDATVNRTTNGEGNVASLTFNEVRALQLKATDGKTYKVPTLEEALAACKDKIHIYLDFKVADVANTYALIKAAGMENQVVVYMNAKEQYKPWQSVAPQMPLMTSLPSEVTDAQTLRYALNKYRISAFDNITDSAMLSVTREQQVQVWLDAQHKGEGPATWQAAIQKGIQGLQTDQPAALIAYLVKNNLR
ncbi:glycerophosphoryl diester phosphodiesterase [Filimonas lacunae]|uniref:Glycerophosphoryl diester phosphodiesterase n=1 Tax=Filimonas lacunae TaxID=477680 RepID=A0A173MGW0_9BACT|nr:glycerophosphodiester phosphodiesterase family protein [Filimonas lacunae]BAV06843.1 glycerophosphoryl diester phosphodiesterase [Filimonas lacunae]SIS98967.1 glycerophosphoryl diester phosphodiesterase [Filimonas lacunae]